MSTPLQESEAQLQLFRSTIGTTSSGEFGTYLDNDMSLSDQADELDLLKNDG